MIFPKIIHQTWKNKNNIPECINNNINIWKKYNPDYIHKFYDDNDCKNILLKHFGFKALLAFCIVKAGAFKGDLFRYAILYLEGGVYSDVDLFPVVKLDTIINDKYDFISVKERDFQKPPVIGIWQAFIACKPQCIYMKQVLIKSIDNIINNYYPNKKSWNDILSITGPSLLKEIVDNCNIDYKIKLYKFNYKKQTQIMDGERIIMEDKIDKSYNNISESFTNLVIKRNLYVSTIDSLHNILKNKNCVVLTCGPSLNEYNKQQIREFCNNKIVICIKETINEFSDICDIFIANESRYRDYDLNKYNCFKIYQKGKKKFKNKVDKYELILEEDLDYREKNKQLLIQKNFDEYTFTNTHLRPWGPGILYETVFYLCQYMGIKNIYTIGWDLIDKNMNNITHYFENNQNDYYRKSLKFGIQCDECKYEKYYKGTEFKTEMIMVNKNIIHMYDFFKNKGMNIYVVGEQSFVNKYIPRIYLNKKLLIKNVVPYHCEIIESIIVKYHEILNIDTKNQLDIYLIINDNHNPRFKEYIIEKYPKLKFENIKIYDYYINCTVYNRDFHRLCNKKKSYCKYISHEITDRLKSNPNVYFLTPLAKTNFIYSDILPFSEQKKTSNIPIYIIQGNLNIGRRYLNLLNIILDDNYPYKFIIKLIGRGTLPKELKKHENKIVLRNNLNFIDYHKEFLDAYCILPLISKKTHPQYYNKKLTSTINYARAYKLKCLIDKDLQEIYKLNDVEIYNDINDIKNSFIKTLEKFYENNKT
tara:strand:+ start:1708 stop:3984 length:2277 start_codon:yes stop_codon:yes gene_type:complete